MIEQENNPAEENTLMLQNYNMKVTLLSHVHDDTVLYVSYTTKLLSTCG